MIVGSILKPKKRHMDFKALLDVVEDGMFNKKRQDKETF